MPPIVARTLVIGALHWVSYHLRINSEVVSARLPSLNALWAQVVVSILCLPVRAGVGKAVVTVLDRIPKLNLWNIIR